MANQFGIATVTATLQQLLDRTVSADVPGASATMISPDGPAALAPDPGVNIFLYQVVPNGAWRNEDLPTRTSSGAPANRPRTAIDLHYLLTFYGDDADFEPQRVMASSIRVLHARPVLTRKQIEAALTAHPVLAPSDLAADVERVKLTQLPLNLEELSKLWSVFFRTTYRLSVAYRGTAVLLEADDPGGDALPVLRRNLYVETLREPFVEEVVNAAGDQLPITFGDPIRVRGNGLQASVVGVRIDDQDAAGVTVIDDTELVATPPPLLRVGIHALQVVHEREMGTPPVAHAAGIASDVVPYPLAPRIHKTGGAYDVSTLNPTSRVVDGVVLHSADVRVVLEPTIGRRQRVAILLNELAGAAAHAYTFVDAPRSADGTTITIPAVDVIPATYLLRVQVDGVDSALDVVAGTYAEPTVAL
jgi:uncharacterized protein DUF4255